MRGALACWTSCRRTRVSLGPEPGVKRASTRRGWTGRQGVRRSLSCWLSEDQLPLRPLLLQSRNEGLSTGPREHILRRTKTGLLVRLPHPPGPWGLSKYLFSEFTSYPSVHHLPHLPRLEHATLPSCLFLLTAETPG